MTIQGLDRLKRKLRTFPAAVEAEIRAAMEVSANEVVALAKSLVPRDTGALVESIGWTWGDAPKGSMTLGKVGGTGNLVITIYAGDDKAFWARWVEFGTSPHANAGMFAGSENPGTRAQPFFYPAYRAVRRRVKGRVTRAVNKAARRIASGG
ncbi:HK97 gp10 family phage protein [Devosia sp. D6-9]|nr:HK97 gp10 family phage protein [Devosia sp. D6-9]